MDNCWESTYLSAETHVSEIYCLRQSFMGMDNLQVITLSLTYQCGIVVYLQGIEIYRDNVLEGPIIESSSATGCFHTSRNHMITRNCKDCTYSTNVLAIMLLAQKDSYFFLNTKSLPQTEDPVLLSNLLLSLQESDPIWCEIKYETKSAALLTDVENYIEKEGCDTHVE